MLEVVEDDERVAQHQGHVGQAERVGVRRAERLDRADEVIAEEADGPAGERRQPGERSLTVALDGFGGHGVRIALVAE